MSKRPPVFDHLGPYSQGIPIAALYALAERVWSTYHDLTDAYEHKGQDSREYLIFRMLYIAEITSTAIRLNASWALTHAGMSLLRDRYEQVVRFSWLVRNPDQTEFRKYERAIFAKMHSLVRNMNPETRAHYQELTGNPLPAWATETLSKEDRAHLDAWNALDLRSMVAKRDAFPPIADTALAKQRLDECYEFYLFAIQLSHTLRPLQHRTIRITNNSQRLGGSRGAATLAEDAHVAKCLF